MKRLLLTAWLLGLVSVTGALAAPPELRLGLDQAETQAEGHSPRLQAKQYELEASRARVSAQAAQLWPTLSLEGMWRYVSEVPSLQVIPNRPSVSLGDNVNYSVGPQITWNLWDSGNVYYAWGAAAAAQRGKEQELAGLRRDLRLRTRLAYFQAQLLLSQVRLLTDALRLSLDQYHDIQAQAAAGSSSRIETLSAHQEVLNDLRQLRRARTELAGSVRDLANLTGTGRDLDLALPLDEAQGSDLPALVEPPTVLLALDPEDRSLQRLEPAATVQMDPAPPQARQLLETAAAAHQAAASLNSGHWPRVQVYGKISLDYPNGPILERFQQNTAGVNASWPLWANGRVVNQVGEQEQGALAAERQAQQVSDDLTVTWQKAHDQLAQLEQEQTLNVQAVKETDDLARLTYQAYQAGRSSHLEVEMANYRALGAKIQAAATRVQRLIQLATLESLAAPNTPASPKEAVTP